MNALLVWLKPGSLLSSMGVRAMTLPVDEKQLRWDRHFLQLCVDHARMSKDPRTKVGAVIVGPDLEIRSAGFNGFPRGIADTEERLSDRETKLRLVVHAEMNAVLAAARIGVSVKGCTMYLVATDSTVTRNLYSYSPPDDETMKRVMDAGDGDWVKVGRPSEILSVKRSPSVWGGPPCVRCTVEVIQAGITEIVSYPKKSVPSTWSADLELAQSLLSEAGITYREVPP